MNAATTPTDEVLTLEELAAYLKVSETTAYALVRGGEIPGRKVGREWRFLKARVTHWLMQAGTEEDMDKTGFVQRDDLGGEFKQEGGQEYVALWLPITREEKAAQIEKATRDGVNVSELVADYLRSWVKA
ncbi:helix-turn-helix domain-containing protein [Deinococcus soli (ex Cha et al. 2016)]|uniref:Excisionase family DNA binding protein n=2 Tax=Deinococcus soli (ex Cha et al. 2016) TaxID=1309411 RepID=A0AAE4BN30_9DEIO|nr:helix-turn-helix domain-containing protein [Deinococcus soli (ex Cha et al. 2016)]MDR6219695.1 excisionase family DNA binding protein [Deinococcus soli (ex Cha et al. 2016)]MDR6329704.1 excisionase family DNA binding protein [Deinococcus soli (ex Cha et al. 2016)]MDR6752603.1 excisionase family DNA binding protein [Deinococcus soli (ex Cha et al. 2016)]